jgi:hypothetical protein
MGKRVDERIVKKTSAVIQAQLIQQKRGAKLVRRTGCIRNFHTFLSTLFPLPNKGYPVTPGMNLFLWASMSKEGYSGQGLARI